MQRFKAPKRKREVGVAARRVNAPPTVKILALMETASLSGRAKNLVGFGRWLRSREGIRRLLRQQGLVARLVAAASARPGTNFRRTASRRLLLGFYAEALGTAGAAAEYRSPVGARPWRIS